MKVVERPPARTIVEEKLVAKRLDQSKEEYPRLEEVFEGIKYRLAREPFKGATRVPNTKPIRYVIKTNPWKIGRVPSVSVVYRVNKQDVLIEALAIRDG